MIDTARRRPADARRPQWHRGAIAAVLVVLTAAPSMADESSLAVRARRIHTAAADGPAVFEPGVLIIRDGVIAAVGSDLSIPDDLPLLDLPDSVLIPGLVAASGFGAPHRGEESTGAAYRAVDAVDLYADATAWLGAGITTVHVGPGEHRLIAGRGAVVRLFGPPEQRLLLEEADLSVALGPGAWRPPDRVEFLVPPASDLAIQPPVPQRPGSRATQVVTLKGAIERSLAGPGPDRVHDGALASAWRAGSPLRIRADEPADVHAAVAFLLASSRSGYVIGNSRVVRAADRLAEGGIPLVHPLEVHLNGAAPDLGTDTSVVDPDLRALAGLAHLTLAFAPPVDQPQRFRLAAAVAARSGLSAERILAAITRVPAEILGVGDRVGAIRAGMDADFVVLTDDPLQAVAHVQRTYVRGRLAWRAPVHDTLVVRAGTIWRGPGSVLHGGGVLIENGRIVEVGHRVAQPPGARVIDAGAGAFLAPGFIDARGHLGLRGDRRQVGPGLSLARLIGLGDRPEQRLAMAGVTTVHVTAYEPAAGGSQTAIVATGSAGRSARLVRAPGAVHFDLRSGDPLDAAAPLRTRLAEAKRYLDLWTKYENDLAEWTKKQAEGASAAKPADAPEPAEPVVRQETDPITGVWSGTMSGMPLPEPMSGRVSLRLTGASFEGRLIEPATDVEHRIVGTLEGDRISGRIEIETGGMGTPSFTGRLTGEDRMSGQIALMGISIAFEATRVEKTAAVRVLAPSRSRARDGRPQPPAVNDALEPLRAVLQGKAPLLVEVDGAVQIRQIVQTASDAGARLVLMGAAQAHVVADLLKEKNVGVILPPEAADAAGRARMESLGRLGIRAAFASGAEDGARNLRERLLAAVERGLSPERAMAAATMDAAALLGIEDRVGRIEPGLDADLVLYSDHPLEPASMVRRVLIKGEEVMP